MLRDLEGIWKKIKKQFMMKFERNGQIFLRPTTTSFLCQENLNQKGLLLSSLLGFFMHVWVRFTKFHQTLGEKALELLVDEGVNGVKVF
jgi:hypothetical protein